MPDTASAEAVPDVPSLDVVPRPPRKWLGRGGGWIIFGIFTAFWLLNLLYNWIVVHSVSLSATTLILGGFAMTAALIYTLAYRLRPHDGITPLRLVLTFLFAGLFTTELAFYIELLVSLVPVSPHGQPGLLVRSLAGVIEEGLKLLAVVIAARGLVNRSTHNGLFMGGAVGLGFAAFEDMRYAAASAGFIPTLHSPLLSVIVVTLGRDLLGPLEHPVFTALTAAALFAATRNGRFRITRRVILVFVAVAFAHGLIDASPAVLGLWLPQTGANALGGFIDLIVVIGGGIVWLRYSRRVRDRMLRDELAPPVAAAV
jgi:RsiW-degrading membrane proteinase PrsW (M82 family)